MGEDYAKLVRKVNSERKKHEEDLKKAYRRQYFYRIHNETLEIVLNKIKTDDYIPPVIQHQLPERSRLQEVMCDFRKDLSPLEIVRRRICAVDFSVALCSRQEIPRRLDTRPQSSSTEGSSEDSLTEDSSTESSRTSPEPDPVPLICEKTQCIFCIGKPGVSTFSRPAKMMDHVESHLRKEPAETIACRHPVCMAEGLVLDNVMHFKNHVQRVHGISLRA
jgi:hypothetical protein